MTHHVNKLIESLSVSMLSQIMLQVMLHNVGNMVFKYMSSYCFFFSIVNFTKSILKKVVINEKIKMNSDIDVKS